MESSTGYGAKVAIPRLRRPDDQIVASAKPPRVRSETLNKACTRCRKRKTKCSGTRPRCTNCEKQGDSCHYEQPRRDRLRDAIHKSDLLATLLKDIRGSLDEEHGRMIDDTLHEFDDESPPPTPSALARSVGKQTRSQSADTENPSEAQVSASVGSNEDLDFLEEDVLGDEDSSVTGYLGRNAQVQWMRSLQQKLDQNQVEPSDLPYAPHGSSEEAIAKRADAMHARQRMHGHARPLRDYYFYLDNDKLADWDDFGTHAVPPVEIAERLLDIYQTAVHPPFRILDDRFRDQLRAYYDMVQGGTAMNVSSKWTAILNLVFAIAARFSHLAGVSWQGDDRDHLVYMTRAVHLLKIQKITAMVGPPDHNMIQATGLLSFYYLTIGHISRAWFTIGIALRHAQAAGFQLRNEDPTVPLTKKRLIAQTWWALHSIECILTSITGRPRVIHLEDCTVPLVSDIGDNTARRKSRSMQQTRKDSEKAGPSGSATAEHLNYSSSLDTFLDSWTKLDIIQHKSLTNIYSAQIACKPWQYTQGQIASLMDELDQWALEALPQEQIFTATNMGVAQQRERLLLYFYYQSAKMCITRPCLCRLDQRLKGQSEESARFNQHQADACIQAALDLTAQLTPPRNARWLYENGPWWSNVHIIMQALTIMLLELAQRTSDLSENTSHLISSVENLVEWLKMIKSVDRVAANAYNIVCELLSNHKHFAGNLSPGQPPQGVVQQSLGQATNSYPPTAAGAQFPTNPQQFSDTNYSTMSFNENFYNNPNEEDFNMSDPFDNLPYRQTPYPQFRGNQFSTLFDQDMDYDLGTDSANYEGWDPMSGEPQQHPSQ